VENKFVVERIVFFGARGRPLAHIVTVVAVLAALDGVEGFADVGEDVLDIALGRNLEFVFY
jgi:hypothetical protein